MSLAYVDTSCLVAVVFDEPGAQELAIQLEGYDRLVASNLLEAELRSAPNTSASWLAAKRPCGRDCKNV
jgi:uncharacterized protein with PIN domain